MSLTAILGATGDIGSNLARRLVTNDHDVILVGRDEEKLSILAGEIDQRIVVNPVNNSDSLMTALRSKLRRSEYFSGFVNCAGSLLLKPAHRTSDEVFRETIEANLFMAFATVCAAATLLREHGGSVVLSSSAAANIGMSNHEAIAAAKSGVEGLLRSAAATFARHNIRFNAIGPGLVKTQLTSKIW